MSYCIKECLFSSKECRWLVIGMKEVPKLIGSILGGDVAFVILSHLQAMRIQKLARRYILTRHRRTKTWLQLRAELKGQPGAWIELERYLLVRREWQLEPESWIHGLKIIPGLVDRIAQEARDGLWGTRM